ncbi:hypothetical protein BH10PAT4_BH10PAT4_0560 [soil metagenome]
MNPFIENILKVTKNISIRNNLTTRQRKTAVLKFVKSFSFVYFGHVDQHDDEHHIIRGLTVSSSHQDDHYSVGSYDGYDVSLVDRYDITIRPGEKIRTHQWIIIEIDLRNGKDIPHIFLGSLNRTNSSYAKLFTSVTSLQAVPLGTFAPHSEEFTSRYSLFAAPTQFIEVERLFTSEVTRTISAHFWPLSAEVFEGSLYIYSDTQNISAGLLETMLKNGAWLANKLDEHSYPTDSQ